MSRKSFYHQENFTGNGECKFCGEFILWGKRNGKPHPFNAVRDENGEFKRDTHRHIVVGGSHVKTCKRDKINELQKA